MPRRRPRLLDMKPANIRCGWCMDGDHGKCCEVIKGFAKEPHERRCPCPCAEG